MKVSLIVLSETIHELIRWFYLAITKLFHAILTAYAEKITVSCFNYVKCWHRYCSMLHHHEMLKPCSSAQFDSLAYYQVSHYMEHRKRSRLCNKRRKLQTEFLPLGASFSTLWRWSWCNKGFIQLFSQRVSFFVAQKRIKRRLLFLLYKLNCDN